MMPLSKARNRARYHEDKRLAGIAHVYGEAEKATAKAYQLFQGYEAANPGSTEPEALYWRQYWERSGR